MKKLVPFALLSLCSLLIGCQSEVDKCVSAFMKTYTKNDELAHKNGANNVQSRDEFEAKVRLGCLQAAGKP